MKLEIGGLLGSNIEYNVDLENHQTDGSVKSESFNAEPAPDGSLIKLDPNVGPKPRRKFKAAQTDVAKLDVGGMTSEEVEEKRKELYQKIDGEWRCLACDYTSSSNVSSIIRTHVETHLDGLCYTCDICNKEYRSRNLLYKHKLKFHN